MRAGGNTPLKIKVREGVCWTRIGETPTETREGVKGHPVGEDRMHVQTGMCDGFSGVVGRGPMVIFTV